MLYENLNKGSLEHVYIFSSKESNKVAGEQYFTPFSALTYAQFLKSQDNDVMLVFDEVTIHHLREVFLFSYINQPFVNILVLNCNLEGIN